MSLIYEISTKKPCHSEGASPKNPILHEILRFAQDDKMRCSFASLRMTGDPLRMTYCAQDDKMFSR